MLKFSNYKRLWGVLTVGAVADFAISISTKRRRSNRGHGAWFADCLPHAGGHG